MDDDAKFCPECGASTSPQVRTAQMVPIYKKSPGLAVVLSFFIIGLGQVYIGLIKKGIILFVLAVVSGTLMMILVGFVLWLLIWAYAIYDAYNSAKKIKSCIDLRIHLISTICFRF